MNPRIVATALGVAFLAGCSSIPLSFLNDRQVSERTAINRVPLTVEAIDGQYVSRRNALLNSIPISPGTHEVLFSAPPPGHFLEPVEKTYPMTVAPCTRYYVAADRPARLMRDWNLVVEYSESVGGCNPSDELKKAGLDADPAPHPAQGASLEVQGPGAS